MQSLESQYYSDPVIFAAERHKILERNWQLVGHAGQVAQPGDYISTTLAGTNVFVIKSEEGALRAFRNICRHRGAVLLGAGIGNCPEIKCRYHDWRYSTAGELTATPWGDDPTPFDLKALGLYPIAVECWRDQIFLAINPATDLIDQLGDLPSFLENAPLETFSIAASRSFVVPINWKIYIDQFCEAYHVPTTHAPDKAIDIRNYRTLPHRRMMLMETLGSKATDAASYYGGKWLWAWPNWTLSLFDGGMKTSRLEPISPSETIVHFNFYFADCSSEGEAARNLVVNATAGIFHEDIAGCRLVQENLPGMPGQSGPLHPELEIAVGYFQDRLREALQSG